MNAVPKDALTKRFVWDTSALLNIKEPDERAIRLPIVSTRIFQMFASSFLKSSGRKTRSNSLLADAIRAALRHLPEPYATPYAMSCDYAVWHTNALLSVTEAAQLYNRLCEGDTSGVVPHPGIDASTKNLPGSIPR
jgi:hypothetical protein